MALRSSISSRRHFQSSSEQSILSMYVRVLMRWWVHGLVFSFEVCVRVSFVSNEHWLIEWVIAGLWHAKPLQQKAKASSTLGKMKLEMAPSHLPGVIRSTRLERTCTYSYPISSSGWRGNRTREIWRRAKVIALKTKQRYTNVAIQPIGPFRYWV